MMITTGKVTQQHADLAYKILYHPLTGNIVITCKPDGYVTKIS